MTEATEVNFDGLVGPTHNYAGLSLGNVASLSHKAEVSNPREAALQGLAKMKFLADRGFVQALLPPLERPDVNALRALGFNGTDDAGILARAAKEAPALLAAASSASSMWTANAATVAPSADTADGRCHLSAANLSSKLHRTLEGPQTARVLRAIFADESRFRVHDPLPGGDAMADEGAANHTRLCPTYGEPGLHVFVFGRCALDDGTSPRPRRFPARQTREACEALARRHGLDASRVCLIQQNPAAIDAGVFHNDVISVGNADMLLYHEEAFLDGEHAVEDIRAAYAQACGGELHTLRVSSEEVPLADAVKSYLFNSQLLSLPDGGMLLLCPMECRENERVSAWLASQLADAASPLRAVEALDLRESMKNGGGPACLRQRVVLTEEERSSLPAGVFVTDQTYPRLVEWVQRHYRESLSRDDLADPLLLEESRRALDELTALLGTGPLYTFQTDA